jgi:hypothetical protein
MRTHILKMMYSPKNSTLGHLVSQEERMWFVMKVVYVHIYVFGCWLVGVRTNLQSQGTVTVTNESIKV